MTTMRRTYQGLHSLFRLHRNYAGCITCSVGSSSRAPSRQDSQPGADFHLHVKNTNRRVLLEMPRQDSAAEFLTEIIKQCTAKMAYGHFFSATAWSQWLSRYGSNKGAQSQTGVSPEEFDPRRHINIIDRPETAVRVTDCVDRASSYDVNWSAVSVPDVLPLPDHTGQSLDSLDTTVISPGEFGQPKDALENQLVMTSSSESSSPKSVSSRQKFIRQCLAKRESDFTDLKPFTLLCGSWNVDNSSPPGSLNPWLLTDSQPPDMVAVGCQELDTSKEAFLNMDTPREAEWVAAFAKCLNSKAPYMKVKSVRLVGLLLAVFVKEQYAKHVCNIDVDTVATGILGIMGNKGGISIRLNFHDTSLCFICSHLAAHQAEVEKRNVDFKTIMHKMKFKMFDPPQEVAEHDLVFWFGDLNYRIDMPIDDVKACIKKRDYAKLLQSDQLYQQMKQSNVFQGFQEGAPNFDPTFKYDPGTDTYDTSEKQRIPAWCDRILWSGSGVKQLRFSSHPEMKMSDHKPVSSLFKVDMRVIDPKRYKRVYEEVMQKLDRLESEHGKAKCVSPDAILTELQPQIVTAANTRQKRSGSHNQVDIAQDGSWLYMVPKEIRKFVDFLYEQGSAKPQCLEAGPCTPDIHQR